MRSRHKAVAATLMCSLPMTAVVGCQERREPDSPGRGSGSATAGSSVENARLLPRFLPGSCELPAGAPADLQFTATNSRTDEVERLLDVTTGAADDVRITPDNGIEIKPLQSVGVGQPETTTADANKRPRSIVLTGLRPDVRPGTSVSMTFVFQQEGDLSVRVPVEDCPAAA